MSTRAKALNGNLFAAFCFTVLEESEARNDVLEENELFELAMRLSEGDPQSAVAFCLRFRGFIEMSDRPEAEDFVSHHPERMMFHPALFEAAATARTRHNGSFPEKPFFKKVRELAATKYEDFDFDT